jgi:hypothetical protein
MEGRDLEPNLVSCDRFKKHCEIHPEWGAEARRISKINGDAGKGARLRNASRCLNGHPFSGENLYIFPGGKERKYITCMKLRYESPVPATAEQIQQVTAALNEDWRPAWPPPTGRACFRGRDVCGVLDDALSITPYRS